MALQSGARDGYQRDVTALKGDMRLLTWAQAATFVGVIAILLLIR
jgi:hypothetical protein